MKIMKVSKIELTSKINGIEPFTMQSLGKFVILAGRNGSGKSRLLKLLENYCDNPYADEIKGKLKLYDKDGKEMKDLKAKLVNYSHYDAPLQKPNQFSPYVISKAKSNLKICDFEETALNALLYIEDLARGYSNGRPDKKKFGDFADFVNTVFDFELTIDKDNTPLFSGQNINDAKLSPGQEYLLRMCVAIYCNDVPKDSILLLDEPETHLHPKAILELVDRLKKFKFAQIWIATHSLALLARSNPSSIYHMDNGNVCKLGSDSAPLIKGLIGGETGRFDLQQFIVSPDAFACNRFAYKCLAPSLTAKVGSSGEEFKPIVKDTVTEKSAIVDFGAGKGLFLGGLGPEDDKIRTHIDYYAYDKFKTDAKECESVMEKFGFTKDRYYNKIDDLREKLEKTGGADYVFMVRVLHEIDPFEWVETFEDIAGLLKEGGALILVEHEELMYGEKPYDNGFLVPTKSAIEIIGAKSGESVKCKRYNRDNSAIMVYTLPKPLLEKINEDTVSEMISEIMDYSLKKIHKIKNPKRKNGTRHTNKSGVSLAFWTHQYANAGLYFDFLKSQTGQES